MIQKFKTKQELDYHQSYWTTSPNFQSTVLPKNNTIQSTEQ